MPNTKSNKAAGFAMGCGIAAAIAVGFLILAFAALWYFGFVQRGGVYDGLRNDLAKSQLSSIIPYIELYKVSNGAYPNELEDIQDLIPDNVPVILFDASAPPLGEQRLYFYQTTDTGYHLFSIGADAIPFTEDDILPEVSKLENTGLVARNVDGEIPK